MGHDSIKQQKRRASKCTTDLDRLIAARIHECRRQRGITQKGLARELGISFQQFQKYEKGTNRVSAGRAFELACIFGVPVESLFSYIESNLNSAVELNSEVKRAAEFASGAEGFALCQAFMQIRDRRMRKQVLSLVEDLG